MIDVIDLDEEDDTPLENVNVSTANQLAVPNTSINVHIEAKISTPMV